MPSDNLTRTRGGFRGYCATPPSLPFLSSEYPFGGPEVDPPELQFSACRRVIPEPAGIIASASNRYLTMTRQSGGHYERR